jgi:hypothetical protein
MELLDERKSIVLENYRFASRSGSQASVAAVLLNLGRKRGWIALQDVPRCGHSFLGVCNVIVAVVALALP